MTHTLSRRFWLILGWSPYWFDIRSRAVCPLKVHRCFRRPFCPKFWHGEFVKPRRERKNVFWLQHSENKVVSRLACWSRGLRVTRAEWWSTVNFTSAFHHHNVAVCNLFNMQNELWFGKTQISSSFKRKQRRSGCKMASSTVSESRTHGCWADCTRFGILFFSRSYSRVCREEVNVRMISSLAC